MTRLFIISSDVVKSVGEWVGQFAMKHPSAFVIAFLGSGLIAAVTLLLVFWWAGPDLIAQAVVDKNTTVTAEEIRDVVREELQPLEERVTALEAGAKSHGD